MTGTAGARFAAARTAMDGTASVGGRLKVRPMLDDLKVGCLRVEQSANVSESSVYHDEEDQNV